MQVGVHTALLHWLILCERYVSKRARILLTLIFSRQTATFLEILPYKLISFLKKKKNGLVDIEHPEGSMNGHVMSQLLPKWIEVPYV